MTWDGNAVTSDPSTFVVNGIRFANAAPSTVVTTDGSGNATITFPAAFGSIPTVVATMGTALRCSLPVAPTFTGFTISVTNAAGAAVASTAVRVYWQANGAA